MRLDLILKYRPFFEAVATAHVECAKRDNLSTQVLRAMHGAGAEDMRAIMTAMATLETLHGPVAMAREQMMMKYWSTPQHVMQSGVDIIYGFGSSFIKGCADPLLSGCESALDGVFPGPYCGPMDRYLIPHYIHSESGKPLYPNMAYYTAILCELIEWPVGFEFLLVCMFRSGEWRAILDS